MGYSRRMKIVAFGTCDTGKPRARILLSALRSRGVEVSECFANPWGGIEDKSQVHGIMAKLRLLLRWLGVYPALIWRYLRLPKHDLVFVGYPGLIDVFVIWPLARLRGVPVVWDIFISLYNTIIEDRRMLSPANPLARLLYGMEYLALRLVDLAIIDTEAHAEYIRETWKRPARLVASVPVGAEPEAFAPTAPAPAHEGFRVLFYGQFIPLHGVDTIARAATLTGNDVTWTVIGKGQERQRFARLLDELHPPRLEWLEWVDYAALRDYLNACDVALGIFGDTDKAARVIPNKVYQILMAGRPLITRDSAAIRELLDDGPDCRLIPAADPRALADAIREMRARTNEPGWRDTPHHQGIRAAIGPEAIGTRLVALLRAVVETRG